LKRETIDPKTASVAATFYEPVYQRLRQWHHGKSVDLLCFVHEPNAHVRELLESDGANRSPNFRAKCFAEIWERDASNRAAGIVDLNACELDKKIAEAMGCHNKSYSAATGFLSWGDIQPESRHHVSRLILESHPKRRR
jgi:hypothetical protein